MSTDSQTPYQPVSQTSTLALVSLISGIVSWFLVPFLGAIVAVITGHMAKKEIRENLGRLTGDGLATAGLVLGYLQLGISLLCICGFLAMMVFGISVPFLIDGSGY
jgi:hypothetical protein